MHDLFDTQYFTVFARNHGIKLRKKRGMPSFQCVGSLLCLMALIVFSFCTYSLRQKKRHTKLKQFQFSEGYAPFGGLFRIQNTYFGYKINHQKVHSLH